MTVNEEFKIFFWFFQSMLAPIGHELTPRSSRGGGREAKVTPYVPKVEPLSHPHHSHPVIDRIKSTRSPRPIEVRKLT